MLRTLPGKWKHGEGVVFGKSMLFFLLWVLWLWLWTLDKCMVCVLVIVGYGGSSTLLANSRLQKDKCRASPWLWQKIIMQAKQVYISKFCVLVVSKQGKCSGMVVYITTIAEHTMCMARLVLVVGKKTSRLPLLLPGFDALGRDQHNPHHYQNAAPSNDTMIFNPISNGVIFLQRMDSRD